MQTMQQYPATQQPDSNIVSTNLLPLCATYQRAGLIVNTKKTEVLAQCVNTSSAAHPTFTVHGDSLNDVHQFTYLGSILTSDCDLNNEIQQRVKLASTAFGRLSRRVFLNRNLAIATKIAVYTKPSVSPSSCTVVNHGLHIVAISRLWRPFTYDVSKASSAFIGGTRSLMLRSVTEPLTLTQLNTCYCKGNSAGGHVIRIPSIIIIIIYLLIKHRQDKMQSI